MNAHDLRAQWNRLFEPRALIDQLAVRIYEEPLVSAWRDRRGLLEVLRTVVLILDFDTEVNMKLLDPLALLERYVEAHAGELEGLMREALARS